MLPGTGGERGGAMTANCFTTATSGKRGARGPRLSHCLGMRLKHLGERLMPQEATAMRRVLAKTRQGHVLSPPLTRTETVSVGDAAFIWAQSSANV